MDAYFVYVIFSEKLNRYYIGTTDMIDKRINEHNNSLYPKSFTSKGIPWTLYLTLQCQSSSQAYRVEKYIKSRKSTAFIKKLHFNIDLRTSLLLKFLK